MEQLNYVDPPNKEMDRTFIQLSGPTLQKDLIFLDINAYGNFLIGSANITASYWEGSVQTYNTYKSIVENNSLSFYNGAIIYDGKYFNNYVLISEGPSYLKLLSPPDEAGDLIWKDYVDHSELVKNISVWDVENSVLTAGDKYITIWNLDNNNLKKLHEYTDFHIKKITSVATRKSDIHLFASTGQDGRTIIWDKRMESPALELYRNEFCGLKGIAWNPSNNNTLTVGSEGGDLYLLDICQPKEFISVQHCFKASLHKIVYNSYGNLAVCGNTGEIQVYSSKKNEFDLIYKSEKHSNFVRDICWYKDSLYSCGFNGEFFQHNL